jgi:hypothetical protein
MCVSDRTDSSREPALAQGRKEEKERRRWGLYLQSNFNGENGSKNNVKIKQNLQNKKKHSGDG